MPAKPKPVPVDRWTCAVSLDLPDSITLGEVDSLQEKLRETAGAWLAKSGRSIAIQWHEANEWNLRGVVEGTIAEIEADYPEVSFPERDEPVYRRWQGEAEGFA